MEDGELEFSNQEMLSGSNFCEFPDSNSYMDSFLNEILKDTHACTHAHTCNPPGPDNSHTHTCYHVHTKIVPAPSEDKAPSDDTAESVDKKEKKRPLGNREAVRKYREKKKAMAALLEDEVVRLRALNQQLLKRLQGQAVLEAEVARLKCLLVDIRGRIEEGGGVSSEGTTLNNQGLFNNCDFESLQCLGNQTSSGFKELPGCGVGNSKPANVSGGSKKKSKKTNGN
nr:basic leucine zipper 23-like [Ipomoea batatas]